MGWTKPEILKENTEDFKNKLSTLKKNIYSIFLKQPYKTCQQPNGMGLKFIKPKTLNLNISVIDLFKTTSR